MIERTVDEAIALLDEIVGRCVADPAYAERVLDDPRGTLEPYQPDDDIIGDFVALARTREQTLGQWAALRSIVYAR